MSPQEEKDLAEVMRDVESAERAKILKRTYETELANAEEAWLKIFNRLSLSIRACEIEIEKVHNG